MSKIKEKMIPDISANKIIENDSRRFVTKQHIDLIESSLAPGSVIQQYDDTPLIERLNEVEENSNLVLDGLNSLTYSLLQNLMKYDGKQALPNNLTGYTFVDCLVDNTNIESCTNCAYDSTNDKIK